MVNGEGISEMGTCRFTTEGAVVSLHYADLLLVN